MQLCAVGRLRDGTQDIAQLLHLAQQQPDLDLGAVGDVLVDVVGLVLERRAHLLVDGLFCGRFGDALANLLAVAGRKVTREYYINDAGAQVDVLGRSAFLRYREALGEAIGDIPEGLYPGDYLKPVGEQLALAHGRGLLDRPENDWLPLVKNAAIDGMMEMIRILRSTELYDSRLFYRNERD